MLYLLRLLKIKKTMLKHIICNSIGFRWKRQLVFRSKLTMHTAYDRKDNAEPASITCISISKYVWS